VFLGSKLGDSMLLHYTREVVQQENGSQRNQEDVQMDEDDLYLYSSKPNVAKEVFFYDVLNIVVDFLDCFCSKK
jgi:hypothetical protein